MNGPKNEDLFRVRRLQGDSSKEGDDSYMKISVFNHEPGTPREPSSSREEQEVAEFWNTPIDYESELLEVDTAPFTVFEQTTLRQIHFLFTMLSIP